MIGNLVRRQLHTIISRQTIKPSSPTPPHLHTYNLSDLDLLNPKAYIPLILFYPNNANCRLTADQKVTVLKSSLSLTLTRHYPFAGRFPVTPTTPSYVDCNDEGVVFVESRNDTQLETFRRMTGQDEILGQLFADGVVHQMSASCKNLVTVQVNHFACGGVGLAISMSHLIGDACSLGSFLSHWASVARYGSVDHQQVLPLNPHFIQSKRTDYSIRPEPAVAAADTTDVFVARRFVFPNSKLSEVKNKVVSEAGGSINNPTRVEVLTSMIFKTAVAAASVKCGSFKPSYLFFMVNMRDRFVEKLPQTTIGNFVSLMMVPVRHTNENSLTMVVAEIKKHKLRFEGIKSVEQLALNNSKSKVGNQDLDNVGKGSYFCSSFCGFPFNKLDFGWGKPMGTTLATKSTGKNGFVLMDTPDGDGVDVLVMLERQHMKIFENDKEMLSFCQTN
ncbi:hypothetical protein R6Q57_028721 [Mikania cordata]